MNIRELPVELKKLAKDEFNEDDKNLLENLHCIIEWINKQPHLNIRTDPQWLVGFLRGCKHSLERTKEKIDNYYTIRTHLPELFFDRDPKKSKIQKLLGVG